jgi:hypothetical protein
MVYYKVACAAYEKVLSRSDLPLFPEVYIKINMYA